MLNPVSLPKIVLVVGDDAGVRQVLKCYLESEGYAVLAVASAAAALEAVDNTRLLAVLLDMGLDGTDGLLVLEHVRTRRPRLPVIIVTGRHDEAEARRAFDLGAWDYVTKPVDLAYIKNVLLLQSEAA